MTLDFRGYLPLAESLLAQANAEADEHRALCLRRTSVSRAYYAGFHAAKQLLDRLKKEFGLSDREDRRGAGSHEQVWKEYEQSSDRTLKTIGGDGFKLKNRRREADYEPVPMTSEEVEEAIERARKISQAIERLAGPQLERLRRELSCPGR